MSDLNILSVSSGIDDHLVVFVTDKREKDLVMDYIRKEFAVIRRSFSVAVIPEFPRNDAGKILYGRLLEQAKSMLLLSAKRIDGAETIYFRFALDLIDDSEEGVFYARGRDGEFRKEPLTQIREYEKDDMEHVGWYYLPVEKGAPMWMPPYHNKNINVTFLEFV